MKRNAFPDDRITITNFCTNSGFSVSKIFIEVPACFCVQIHRKLFVNSVSGNKQTKKQIMKQTNKQTNKKTNEQTNKQTNKQTNEPTRQQTNEQINEQANKHTPS